MICCLSSIHHIEPGSLPEHNCFEPVITVIRAWEAEGTIAKTLTCALVIIASLVLFASLVGIPFFLAAYQEYVHQELEPHFQAAVQNREANANNRINELTQEAEVAQRRIKELEREVAKKPDPDDANLGFPTTPRGTEKNKDEQILSLTVDLIKYKAENEKLKTENHRLEAQRNNTIGGGNSGSGTTTTFF